MAPSIEAFEDLQARVDRLERLLRAQAAYHAELLAYAPHTATRPGDEELLLSQEEAAHYLGCGASTIRNKRKEWGLRVAARVGNRPRYRKSDLDKVRSKHFTSAPPD